MDIVDTHAHVLARDRERYPLDPLDGTLSPWAIERPVDGDELLRRMDAARIARTILVTPSNAYAYDNSYAADVAGAHPERLGFVGAIDVHRSDAPAFMTRWVRERGMAGFRLFARTPAIVADPAWLADPATFPAWDAAHSLGITISVHCEPPAFTALGAMLARFPGVTVALDHCGLPDVTGGPAYAAAQPLFDLSSAPNLMLKLSSRTFHALGATPLGARPFVERIVSAYGAQRIAWASNFPSSPGTLAALRELAQRDLAFLPESDRTAIFHDTALRIYPPAGPDRRLASDAVPELHKRL